MRPSILPIIPSKRSTTFAIPLSGDALSEGEETRTVTLSNPQGGTLFDNIDHLASNILLPLGGLFITIFAGWVMCKNSSSEELGIGTGLAYGAWRMLARWLAPAAVLIVFLHATGLLGRIGMV